MEMSVSVYSCNFVSCDILSSSINIRSSSSLKVSTKEPILPAITEFNLRKTLHEWGCMFSV